MPLRPTFLLLASLLSLHSVAADTLVKLTPEQARRLGVETLTIGGAGGMEQKGLPAQVVVPNAQLRVVSAPLAGVVEALLVAPGMSVRKGQTLARLASPQALELQRDIHQTGAQSELARQTLKRDETLYQEGLIAESRLQASRAAARQAEAAAVERRQALGLAGAAAGAGLTLVASMDGVVLEQGGALGQRVEAGTPLYRIGRLNPLWLELQVSADLATRIREGMAVEAAGAKGKIINVGRAASAGSQTVLVRVLMNEGLEALRPGQTVEARLALPPGQGTSLPANAVIRNEGKAVAFVQTEGGYRPTPVRILGEAGDTIQVEGLKTGDKVAVGGTSGLKAILTGVGKE